MGIREAMSQATVLGQDDYRRRYLGEYDNIVFKTGSATAVSAFVGAMVGNLQSIWQYPLPKPENREFIKKATANNMKTAALTFALVGGSYAFADCVAEHLRGKRNFANSIYAGIAAGAVFGLRTASIPMGVGAAAAFAASTAVMDALGHTTRRPTDKEFLPYPKDL